MYRARGRDRKGESYCNVLCWIAVVNCPMEDGKEKWKQTGGTEKSAS